MRQLSTICITMLFAVAACRRDNQLTFSLNTEHSVISPRYLATIEQYLKDSMPTAAYDSLQFQNILVSSPDSGLSYFIRVPAIGQSIAHHFVLLKTDSHYSTFQGAIFTIQRDPFSAGAVAFDSATGSIPFSGQIIKTSLMGTTAYITPVTGGLLGGLQGGTSDRQPSVAEADNSDYIELQEIVIIAPSEDPDDYYVELGYLLSTYTGGGGSGTSGGGSGSPISYVSSTGLATYNPADDAQAGKPGINIHSFLDCFGNIPDQNAIYTAALDVRIPNLSSPGQLLNSSTMQVGHAFIQLTKSAPGYAPITQYIGFYANSPTTFTNNPVGSKLVDNSGHLYDAQLIVNMTADQFAALTKAMIDNSVKDYELTGYNCAGYATDVFNSVMIPSLDPPTMAPFGMSPGIFPNSLYEEMQTMHPTNPNVSIKFFPADQIAGTSKGACN